jgi:hypothetical protein
MRTNVTLIVGVTRNHVIECQSGPGVTRHAVLSRCEPVSVYNLQFGSPR